MIDSKFRLSLFFHKLIKIGIEDMRSGGGRIMGCAVDKLVEDMCTRQDRFLDRIINDYSGHSHEYRLNNAGLKMYWEMVRTPNDGRKFVCSIGGDQAKDYPSFVAMAREQLKYHDCCKIKWRNIS